jgi:hypothetical protein
MTQTISARDIFQAAYENRYTWDHDFPGYRADLEVKQGDEVYTGQVTIKPDLTVEVTGFADEKVQESVYNQIRDIVTHRKRSTFEQAHGKNEFSQGETDATGAVEILVKGDAMGSNYKVRGKEISQVSRVMGPMAFTINTQESLDTGEGYVSTKYNAVFRDSKSGDLRGKRDFEETYEKFGEYFLPTRQIIHALDKDDQKTTTEFNFSNIELL